MSELVFDVHQEEDGGYYAVARGEGVVTQGDTWDELCEMVIDATRGYFYNSAPPERLRLVLQREQVLLLEDAA